MNSQFVVCDEHGTPLQSQPICPTHMFRYYDFYENEHDPLRRKIRLAQHYDHKTLDTTLAIYRDELRVFLFPLTLGLSEQVTANLGTAESDFIEAVFLNTKIHAAGLYRSAGFHKDKDLPAASTGLVFVGICQSIEYSSLWFKELAGERGWTGQHYFVTVETRSENSELARLIETLDPAGGCVMATDALYMRNNEERLDEKLVQAILKEPHRFFLNDFGNPLDKRFKHAIIGKFDSVDHIDRNPQRIALGFGFRINFNLTNRLLPASIRKERFVMAAYREALRRKPDLFSCFGMETVDLVSTDELDMFLSHLEPMQILINGTRFHTPSGYIQNYQPQTAIENPELTIETIRKALNGVVTESIRTCGIVYDGLRQLFVPEANDTNHLALKHQIPADRKPLAFTDGLYMRVNAK